ncbi:MAG: translation initiation factor [Muribaculaceae bacterium]|nr:translation initiation factor [Muribaculaceae bacterium]
MDWKEMLLAKSAELGIAPEDNAGVESAVPETETESAFDPRKHPAVHVVVERKGRGGKTATIIEGFDCTPDQLKDIAARLKTKLGTGGSARGGEILIQGDCRNRVMDELRTQGFKVKG